MEVKEERLKELVNLGFKELTSEYDIVYYEKYFEWGEKIVVGSPYTKRRDVSFYQKINSWGDVEENTNFVPIWAFKTIVKMVQMELIDEE